MLQCLVRGKDIIATSKQSSSVSALAEPKSISALESQQCCVLILQYQLNYLVKGLTVGKGQAGGQVINV